MLSNKRSDNIVIIFAKKPEPGKVKTRIAEETSNRFAYEFTKACFTDLLHKINNSDYYDLIVGVDSSDDLDWFQKNFSLEGIVINFKKRKTIQETQSDKFENIFSTFLNKDGYNYKKAILIPMDIPFISEEDLITAFARLEQKKFVHGPEVNGGVYLIGIKSPYVKRIFKGVRWSTSHSFDDLVKNCGRKDAFFLKLKNDLNMPEDILKLRDDIHHYCPILYEFLKRNGYYLSLKNKYINFDDLSISIPVVSNLVKKTDGNEIEILLQTRYKPNIDPQNTGKLEIPSGLIKKYELAQEAAIRETEEETGIISQISSEQKVVNYITSKNGDVIAVYKPFCCHQQLKGGRAYISMGFVSDYVKGELRENLRETRNPFWMPLSKIKKIVEEQPEEIFSLSLAILNEYLKHNNKL